MKHKPAMFALLRLHAELGGEIKENRKEHRRLAKCMLHVEAVLKMLEPGFNVRPISVRRRKPNQWFKRGTVFRHALDVLRTAERPLTTREITDRMLKAKGIANAKPKAVRDLTGGVQSSLRNHKGGNVIAHDETMPVRWSVAA